MKIELHEISVQDRSAIRQDFLETALDWISNGKIEDYMSKNQQEPNANELWLYFQDVNEKSTPPVNEIMKWDSDTKVEVIQWASAVHVEASDNIVEVPEVPKVIEDWVNSLTK